MAFLNNVQSAPQSYSFSSTLAAEQWLRAQGAVPMRNGAFKMSTGLVAAIQTSGRGAVVSFSGCAC